MGRVTPPDLTPAALQLIASFFARPGGPRVLELIEDHGLTPQEVREIVEKVRREVWRDYSGSSQPRRAAE